MPDLGLDALVPLLLHSAVLVISSPPPAPRLWVATLVVLFPATSLPFLPVSM